MLESVKEKLPLVGIALVVLVPLALVIWHLHLFGLGKSAPVHHAPVGSAGFAPSSVPALQSSVSVAPLPTAVSTVPAPAPAPALAGRSSMQPVTSTAPVAASISSAPGPASTAAETSATPSPGPSAVSGSASTVRATDAQALMTQFRRMNQHLAAIQQELHHPNEPDHPAGPAREVYRVHRLGETRSAEVGHAEPLAHHVHGWSIEAIGQTEAWLKGPDGKTEVVTAGSRVHGLQVLSVQPDGVATNHGVIGW